MKKQTVENPYKAVNRYKEEYSIINHIKEKIEKFKKRNKK